MKIDLNSALYREKIAPTLLRVGMAFVFLWFGFQQLYFPDAWVGFLPSWISVFPVSALTFIHLNAWFEIVLGFTLFFGLYTRLVALLLALHLFGIAFSVGWGAIAVRDIGLSVATLTIVFIGSGKWSLDEML